MNQSVSGTLGGASFQVTADATKFQSTLKEAKTAALQANESISGNITNINQTVNVKFAAMGREVDKAAKSLGKVNDQLRSKTSSNFSRGLLQAAYAADDLQYGFRSVVNNIPQMLMFLGPGIAGAAGVAAVSINILINKWDELTDAIKTRWLGTAAEDLGRVRERAVDAAEAFKGLQKHLTPAEQARKTLWERAIVEAPGGHGAFRASLRGVLDNLEGTRPGESQQELIERKKFEERKKVLENMPPAVKALDITKREMREVDKKLEELIQKRMDDIMGGLVMGGPESETYRTQIRELMKSKKFKEFFSEQAKNFARMTEPGRVEGQLENDRKAASELKRIQDEEAVNKAAAGKMATGPLGTALMYGANETTPAPSKITQKQVIARARKLYEAEEERRRKAGLGSIGKFEEAGIIPRFTPAARQQLRDEQAKLPEAATNLEKAAKEMMRNAGVTGDPKGVIAEMRKLLEERRNDIMARTGATKEQAEAMMRREQAQAGQGVFGPPAQRMGLVEFAHMTQGGILNNNIPAQQLEQLRKMNITLDMMAKRENKAQPAVAGK
jgi:hypothetical protein